VGKEIVSEKDIKGTRGAYFINSSISLNQNETNEWLIVSEINQDLTDLTKIKNLFKKEENIKNYVLDDVKKGTKSLMKIVASADGLQLSQDKLITSRHFSNVLFNTMRGGIFYNSYIISKNDFILFVKSSSRDVYKKHKSYLDSFNDKIHYDELKKSVKEKGDSELLKIFLEYLPLIFSRRHGDPSRPWNYFSIDIKNKNGEKILNYEGNWRDLFQNWEALAISYPEYIEAMITKFLNASTADGYNPYRVTRNGFDWEAPEEDTPWANIGYWGDHQIIYLLKLLELSVKYHSSDLSSRLTTSIYTYANVPYRIKSYKELLADSQNTIDFDYKLNEQIIENEREVGTEARYLRNQDGRPLQVNLAEKLIVALLAKLSNFILGAGIWMNTQRPEWNDANNALVGNGVSMVTLYYIRRYLTFCFNLFSKMDIGAIALSEEVVEMFEAIYKTFDIHKDILKNTITDENRKTILDSLGIAGENYRNKIYNSGFSNIKKEIKLIDLIDFLSLVRKYVDQTISINKRDDNLYHAYNLMIVSDKDIKITHLYEMLEGQVAVLSSGYLSADQSLKILKALRNSSLYREDQNSYILYPDRELPQFVNKNTISSEDFKTSKLLQKLIESKNNDIVLEDEDGNLHFNGEIRNAKYLSSKLEILKTMGFGNLIDLEGQKILELYESQFNHKSFTGRSGTFYKYEGLGCIYWHMVSKLLLAVQETYFEACRNSVSDGELETLKNYYYQIKDGLGVHKSPEEYGAFPTDPYSHTPSFSGVQQPGMTGQVKEDIISRFGEFGVQVIDGEIAIVPSLLNTEEFLLSDESFNYFDIYGDKQNLKVNKNSLAFTFCQVPFIYSTFSDENLIIITKKNGDKVNTNNLQIDKELSRSIFKRDGKIIKVEVLLGNGENPQIN